MSRPIAGSVLRRFGNPTLATRTSSNTWASWLRRARRQLQTGMVVYTDSPRAIANQKAVMELLLINHPVDCPVCDQAGECHLQDYSYQYGRGQSRFQEDKNKQPKKDLGPNVLLYADRCIMCTRCVRFVREITGTGELMVEGRGSHNQIDVFPGMALDNELSANVIDLCPVGALLDKDFLFQQRVWYLGKTPSIDGITASGDNIFVEHNEGTVYRVKPRRNDDINKWWITDEVRYGWKFVHSEERLSMPRVAGEDPFAPVEAAEAWTIAIAEANRLATEAAAGKGIALLVSPMLSCEDAYLLVKWVRRVHPEAVLGIGPVPSLGEEKTFPGGFTISSEKAPNARGVRRVLASFSGEPLEADAFFERVKKGVGCVILTGNYPSTWVTEAFVESVGKTPLIMFETLPNRLIDRAHVVFPSATWVEKAGTFENVNNVIQCFRRAIPPLDYSKSESQIAIDLVSAHAGEPTKRFDDATTRAHMATQDGLDALGKASLPAVETPRAESDLVLQDLTVTPPRQT